MLNFMNVVKRSNFLCHFISGYTQPLMHYMIINYYTEVHLFEQLNMLRVTKCPWNSDISKWIKNWHFSQWKKMFISLWRHSANVIKIENATEHPAMKDKDVFKCLLQQTKVQYLCNKKYNYSCILNIKNKSLNESNSLICQGAFMNYCIILFGYLWFIFNIWNDRCVISLILQPH